MPDHSSSQTSTLSGLISQTSAYPWQWKVLVAWAAFLTGIAIFQAFDLDFRVADFLYSLEGHQWAFKHQYLFETVLHNDARGLSKAMGGIVIIALIFVSVTKRAIRWRRPLLYLFLAVGLSTLAVSVIKHLVPMDCPWNLMRYGGDQPFVGLLATRPDTMPDTACFPAGHASAGYAWIALYFFLAAWRPRWRFLGLATGLLMGLVFGIAQQFRGAHFLSHDLWTLMICWTISFSLASLILPGTEIAERGTEKE